MTEDEELLISSLRMLGDTALGDAELDRRVNKFKGALRRLRDDPVEAARIDALVTDAELLEMKRASDSDKVQDWPRQASGGGMMISHAWPSARQGPAQTAAAGHATRVAALSLADVSTAPDVSEFRDFYLSDYQGVVRFLMRTGASLGAAEDAAQEAFTEAWRRIRQGTWADIINQKTWVRMVALNAYRHPPGPPQVPAWPVPNLPDYEGQHGDSHDDLTSQTSLVLDALRSLPYDLQVVVALRMEGFPASVSATYLGITEQKARNLLKRARKILAPQLEELTTPERRRDRDR
jgi:DNA-directed RNA polymerase specialized sigma24 family protein